MKVKHRRSWRPHSEGRMNRFRLLKGVTQEQVDDELERAAVIVSVVIIPSYVYILVKAVCYKSGGRRFEVR
jgi:hypothetical protein